MQQTAPIAYEKTSDSYRDAKVFLVQRLCNYSAGKHTGRDGKPAVTPEARTTRGMAVLSCTTMHLSLAPGDVDALLSIVEGCLALKAAGERESWGVSQEPTLTPP